MSALGIIWADGVWEDTPFVWDTAIWAQVGTAAVDAFDFPNKVGVAQSATNVESGTITFTNVLGTQNVVFTGSCVSRME